MIPYIIIVCRVVRTLPSGEYTILKQQHIVIMRNTSKLLGWGYYVIIWE